MKRSTNVFGGNGRPSKKRRDRPTEDVHASELMNETTMPSQNRRESINTASGQDMTMHSPSKRRRLSKIELTDTEIETIKTLLEALGGPEEAANFEDNMATNILRKVLLTV